jgi:hypothetical protein
MTEHSKEPEPDIATQIVDIGKKYVRALSLSLDSVIQQLEGKKPVAKPATKPSTQNLGISGWLKGPAVAPSTRPTDSSPTASGALTIACWNCHGPVIFYRQDTSRNFLEIEPCERGDSIQAKATCPKCGKESVRYWHNYHPQMGFARV